MISRIWHGWTTHENASKYEYLLRNEIFTSIEKKNVKGYRKISLLKRILENEIEFITIMGFESWDAVRQFAGEDYEKAYVPPKARAVLERFDKHSQHYEVKGHLEY